MKKNCNRCRALIVQQGKPPKCELGHPIEPIRFVPTEPCEKPTTYASLIEAYQNKAHRSHHSI